MKTYEPWSLSLEGFQLQIQYLEEYAMYKLSISLGEYWEFVVFKILVNFLWIVEFIHIALFILLHYFFEVFKCVRYFLFHSWYLCLLSLFLFHCLIFFWSFNNIFSFQWFSIFFCFLFLLLCLHDPSFYFIFLFTDS